MSNITTIKHISECFVKPKYQVDESKQPHYLTQWDLPMLSFHYIQKGLLYPNLNREDYCIDKLLKSLKDSLALTLVHFYPLAGQLVTNVDEDHNRSLIFVDCKKGPGARFIHCKLYVTVSDIVSSVHGPSMVYSLFVHYNCEVGYDGHTLPNLSVQVTELVDGVFIGCSLNHGIVDGTSFWHFWNMWSEIHRAQAQGDKSTSTISRPPVYKRWYPDGYGPCDLFLPSMHADEFITSFNPPQLKEKFCSFGVEAIQKLKTEANEDTRNHNTKVSSYQALAAFVWRSVIRAKRLTPDVVTHCMLAASNRNRVNPTLPQEYFGNSVDVLATSTTVGDLLETSLGRVARLLNQSVVKYTDKVVRGNAQKWFESPFVHQFGSLADTSTNATVVVSSSPRFEMYGNEFAGLGKPIAVRSGFGNKFSGSVTAYAGNQGTGKVDFEICLKMDAQGNLSCGNLVRELCRNSAQGN